MQARFFRNISLNKFDFPTAFFEQIRVRVIYSPPPNQCSQCIKKCLCVSDIIGLKAVTINIIWLSNICTLIFN